GASYAYMTELMGTMDQTVATSVDESERIAIITLTSPGHGASGSVNSGFVRLMLVPANERERSQAQIASQLQQDMKSITGATLRTRQDPTIGDRRGGLPVQFVIQAPTLEHLEAVLPEFLQRAGNSPILSA